MMLLKTEKPQAIGHLHLFWWWCVDYAPEGDLSVFNDAQLARAGEWTGGSEVFVKALVDAGFLERRDGVLTIHDWQEFSSHYNLMLSRKKIQLEKTRERVRRFRTMKRTCNAAVTQCNASTQHNTTQHNTTQHAPPSRRAFELAERLKVLILGNNPKAKLPQDYKVWALEVDRMIRLDKRTESEIEQVMDFSQKDDFWRSNILSVSKLRKKFDQLWLKMQKNPGLKMSTYNPAYEEAKRGS